MKPKLIVHGGAWNIPDNLAADHIAGVKDAIQRIYPDLLKGMPAIDAVEKAIHILEEDPTFDAGRGAFLNDKGEIELDAMIMDGITLNFGAVAAVQNILHPVSLARKIMEETEHCFLVGNGAQEFARKIGVPELDPTELLTERELFFHNLIKHDPTFHTRKPFDGERMGTVGAVVQDTSGNFAAATSTGGTPRKLPGRVGDTPLVGAGTYADNHCGAASATGWGESIMKILLSKTVCDLFREFPAIESAQKSINILKERVNGLGGIIGINLQGEYAFAHNTSKMAFAYMKNSGKIIAKIKL